MADTGRVDREALRAEAEVALDLAIKKYKFTKGELPKHLRGYSNIGPVLSPVQRDALDLVDRFLHAPDLGGEA